MLSMASYRTSVGGLLVATSVCMGCDGTEGPAAPADAGEYATVPVRTQLSSACYALHIFRIDLDGRVPVMADHSYSPGDPRILVCPGGRWETSVDTMQRLSQHQHLAAWLPSRGNA